MNSTATAARRRHQFEAGARQEARPGHGHRLWNLGTWWLGPPAWSSHTLIGSIIGVGVANAPMPPRDGVGVDDAGGDRVVGLARPALHAHLPSRPAPGSIVL